MDPRRRVIVSWSVLAALAALLVIPVTGPFARAWLCYVRHAERPVRSAEVLHKFEDEPRLEMRLVTGSDRGETCSAKVSGALWERVEVGSLVDVVFVSERASCVTLETIEASGLVLCALTGGVASVLLLLAAAGLWLQRSFTRPVAPDRCMDAAPDSVLCPVCGGKMAEGYLPLLAGVHWREPGQPIGVPHALAGLPGTVGWKGRPRLHAFRCTACEVVTLQYGHPLPAPDAPIH